MVVAVIAAPDTPAHRPATGVAEPRVAASWLTRHYGRLRVAVLLLAAFNLTYRLGVESVAEWDESLYATSAWEMLAHGDPIAVTFRGALDYYNTKPPLAVWIIAAAFSVFGVNLLALRLASAAFAWLTVWVLQRWACRTFGPIAAIVSSLTLATSFPFLHLHAGRSGNPDALLTLLILLVLVVLWYAPTRPMLRIWLGPLLAGVFLLKGPAVLLPLALVVGVELVSWSRAQLAWGAVRWAAILFVALVGPWVMLRYRLDGWAFFERMIGYDLVARSVAPLEGHDGNLLYYLDVLVKHQYDWLVGAALLAAIAGRARLARLWRELPSRARHRGAVVLAGWAVATLVVPSLVQTRLQWYLNPFYPLFALGVGWLVAEIVGSGGRARWSGRAVAAVLTLAVVVAEARTLWRLHTVTNFERSVQGVVLEYLRHDSSRRVFRDRLQRAEAFVVEAIGHSRFAVLSDTGALPTDAAPGDLVVVSLDRRPPPGVDRVDAVDGHGIYQVRPR